MNGSRKERAREASAAARWRRVEARLDELLDLETPAARAARLAAIGGEEPELAAELRELAAAVDGRRDLLDAPIAAGLSALIAELERAVDGEAAHGTLESDAGPREIDRYRLLEPLGRGGMGVVYLAERADRQFEQRVALKLLPRGLETPEKVRRFRRERQILARLEHPGIARLLDGGVTGEGFPYLVMERIEGDSIDRFCARRALPLRARLELFLEVCAAVEYAHAQLVIHRDLKPGNILVTPAGGVKLLDFGIAKILEEEDEGTPPTRFQPRTPDYASPEQLADRPVSTASDVYSLGALLYRLLTGTTPARLALGVEGLGASGGPPPSPPPSRAAAAAARLGQAIDPAAGGLAERIPGELDRIVLHALEPEPANRYPSVAAFAEDLRRHLAGLPVSVLPPTRLYRALKFVARHRAATAIAAAIALLLLFGGAAILWQARIAAHERDRARTEAARAERVAEFVGGLFEAASPASADAGRTSLRDLLEEGEAQLAARLDTEPAVRGKLRDVLAAAQSALGDHARAAALARAAVADLRRVDPPDRPALAAALTTLAAVELGRGGHAAAGTALREARALLAVAGATGSRAWARLLHQEGVFHARTGDEATAERRHREALALWRALGAEAEAATERVALAGRLDALARPEEALETKRDALAALRRVYGDAHPSVLATRNNVAYSLHTRGRFSEAEAIYREVLAETEALLGPGHPGLADPLGNLGKVLMDQGDFAGAEPLLRRAAEIRRASVDPDHFGRIAAELNLAGLELALGAHAAAIARYRDGLERFERVAGADSLPAARCRSLLGIALHRAGDPAGAEPLLRAALARQRAGGRPLDLADTLAALGALLAERDAPAALALVEEALAVRRAALPAAHASIVELDALRDTLRAHLDRPAGASSPSSRAPALDGGGAIP